jgi:hypothetical protein
MIVLMAWFSAMSLWYCSDDTKPPKPDGVVKADGGTGSGK